jgi:hypothetical protein
MGQRFLISDTDLKKIEKYASIGKFHEIDSKLRFIKARRYVGDSRQPIQNDCSNIKKVLEW